MSKNAVTAPAVDKEPTPEQLTSIKAIYEMLMSGFVNLAKAATFMAQQTAKCERFPEMFTDQYSSIPKETVYQLVKIGNKETCIEWLINGDPVARAMRQLPFEGQSRFLNKEERIEVWAKTENGWEVALMRPADMTPKQLKQVFNRKLIRNIPQQRAWISDEAARLELKKAVKAEDLSPWRVDKSKGLIIIKPSKFEIIVTPDMVSRWNDLLLKR